MILIFFLCLKLSIFHLSVSDLGYQCKRDDTRNDPNIFLIEDRNNYLDSSYQERHEIYFGLNWYQIHLNYIFERLCSDYYNIIKGSLEESEIHKNVIHFAVPDYYEGKPLKNFVYAGNISKIDDAVCTRTKDPPEFDCNEIVNLVSKSVLEIDDGHVYNFVLEMEVRAKEIDQIYRDMPYFHLYPHPFEITHRESCEPLFRNTTDLNIVLLCLRWHADLKKEVNIQPLQLIQVADCSHYLSGMTAPSELKWNKNSFLAVLAPEPFDVPSEYSVPTIFYKTPYLFSEDKTTFPNSMNLVPWRLLKYGFLKFIQTVGWQRVAIVTDDSEYSLDFEDELTPLFNKEQIMYTVIRCEGAKCEMDKIAQELSRISAKIVIANVEENHAEYLFRNAHDRITWLVRDMDGERHNQYLPKYQAFSISLSIDSKKGCAGVEDNILTGLSSIAQAYKNVAKADYKVKKLEFYRRFADKAKQVTPIITEATVVVRKLYTLEEVSRISVNAAGATLNNFTNPYPSGNPTDGTAHCLATSYDYHKPCEDPLVMFLMFILMLFMLTFLLIICYFDKTSPFNDIRYQNF